ncbi:hypothetical protein HYY70_04370 [Candidatus Woesearchaeota archaeon]|nr:hypothetical protein [Candidatus Woesearchaeota archaeon]
MNKKTVIGGSAVALGLAGLVWLVTENEIRALQNKALNRELAAEYIQDPLERILLQELSEKLTRRADFIDKIQSLNPWAYMIPYVKRFYYMHFRGSYKRAKQY